MLLVLRSRGPLRRGTAATASGGAHHRRPWTEAKEHHPLAIFAILKGWQADPRHPPLATKHPRSFRLTPFATQLWAQRQAVPAPALLRQSLVRERDPKTQCSLHSHSSRLSSEHCCSIAPRAAPTFYCCEPYTSLIIAAHRTIPNTDRTGLGALLSIDRLSYQGKGTSRPTKTSR